MQSVLDAIMKASIIVAVAIGSASIAYHYLIYVPNRDSIIDADRRASDNEKRKQELLRDLEKDARSKTYNTCLANADTNYRKNWNVNCKIISDRQKNEIDRCIKIATAAQRSPNECQAKETKPETDCTLPTALADGVNKDLNEAQDRCLREFQAGVSK